ncbi:hypothetical protein [Robbsia andropogonis]|uniref:hypothetical protein n=1 Tax=Robbsia andropogonis TaxID=28092 RepID=UPI00046416E0|nr:hypothetical protein [Robbsia andropogonis]
MGKLFGWAAMSAVSVLAGGVWRVVLLVLREHAIEREDPLTQDNKTSIVKPATITLTSATSSAPVSDRLVSH